MENKELKRTVGFYVRDENEKLIIKNAIKYIRESDENMTAITELLKKEGLIKDQLA